MARRTFLVLGSFLLLALGLALLAVPSQAMPASPSTGSVLYVNGATGSDTGNCTASPPATPCKTIGYAYNQAISGNTSVSDTIKIAPGTYPERLTIDKYIILQGTSAATTIIDGGEGGTVIQVGQAKRAAINNLTIQNGNAGTGPGGGILVTQTSAVSIRNSFIMTNTAGSGGGIYTANGASVFIIRSALQNNTATGNGGGLLNDVGATTTITQSAVVSNTAQNGAGIYNNNSLTMTNSTIAGNAASGSGGGLNNTGTGSVALSNVTIASNTATGDGGGVTNNSPGSIKLQNSIVGQNSGPAASPDCLGALTDFPGSGYNILQNGTGCTGLTTGTHGDFVGTNPLLNPLALNGGFTLNMYPQTSPPEPANSPAIDNGDPTGCKDAQGNLLTVDQRGTTRPQGVACDIGADEVGMGPVLASISPDSALAGSPDIDLAVTGANFESGLTTVWWNTNQLSTTFVSSTALTATVPANLLATPQIATVTVKKTGQNAGVTVGLPFSVIAPHATTIYIYLPLIMR